MSETPRSRPGRRSDPTGSLFVESLAVQDPEGPRFVFLHGLGGTHRYWTAATGRSWLPRNALLIDLFGFGRSPRPLLRYTLETHLAALDTVLAGETRLILVGHSLGAALALAYAARHPHRVEALVLIALPAYGDREAARRWLRPWPRGWLLTNMTLTAAACFFTRRLLGPILPHLLRNIPPDVARDTVEHNFLSSTTSLWEVLYRHDVVADFRQLPESIPVTFIHGTSDRTAPIESIERLARGRVNTELRALADVDHHPWLGRPAECAAAIIRADPRAVELENLS